MKSLTLLITLILIVALGFAQNTDIENVESTITQPVLIEKVEADADKHIIPYEKWKLPNGLTVIIHEDHSDPIAVISVAYHVGSARETPGKSGFAHFFEHMMFQGSDNVADEDHFRIVGGGGGSNNAFTSNDITFYYEIIIMI